MPRPLDRLALSRATTLALSLAVLISWGIALWQALPRLSAGPLCGDRGPLGMATGHCPACGVALLVTLAWLTHLAVLASRSRALGYAKAQ